MAKNPIRSLAGQTAVYGMGTILPRLLNYFLVPFYTRVFDQAIYGQITELYAYIAFFMVLLTYGMETAFFRFAQKHDPAKVFNNAMSSIILTTSLFLLLIFLFYQPLANSIHYNGHPEYILFAALIVAFDAITAIPFAMLRKRNKARLFAIVRLVNVVANIGMNILFIIVFPEISLQIGALIFGPEAGLVVWVFFSNLISSILSLMMLGSVLKSFRWQIDSTLFRPMMRYALPVLVVGLAGMVIEMIDKILLKYLLPEAENPMAQLGIYGANYKLGVMMTLFIQMFRYAAEPFFFAEAEKRDAPELFAKIMNYFVISGLLIFLIVTLYIDLFQHFIGKSYREGLGIVPVVLIANLFYGIYFNLSIWYKLTDRTADGAKISIAGAVLTIVLNILLIPIFGYHGAAWTHFVCYFLMMTASWYWGQKVYSIPYNLKRVFLYAFIAVAVFSLAKLTVEFSLTLRLVLNTIMLGAFTLFAFLKEQKPLNNLKR
ncbi:MAG: polysaccharide biosynthesis protein [Bacteroidetes bacterium HGW-Bacteroidetes-1]|jgi:O-antigen/teichoic acid export membrane protein|nr:MAG: polysaccharide biosynthesis protein [Bacteroidetes bacterium HGW-Bacteroidetes-1]